MSSSPEPQPDVEMPLGNQRPLGSAAPLGQVTPRLQFMRPLGAKPLGCLNPDIFNSGLNGLQEQWPNPLANAKSFSDSPFFPEASAAPASSENPSPNSPQPNLQTAPSNQPSTPPSQFVPASLGESSSINVQKAEQISSLNAKRDSSFESEEPGIPAARSNPPTPLSNPSATASWEPNQNISSEEVAPTPQSGAIDSQTTETDGAVLQRFPEAAAPITSPNKPAQPSFAGAVVELPPAAPEPQSSFDYNNATTVDWPGGLETAAQTSSDQVMASVEPGRSQPTPSSEPSPIASPSPALLPPDEAIASSAPPFKPSGSSQPSQPSVLQAKADTAPVPNTSLPHSEPEPAVASTIESTPTNTTQSQPTEPSPGQTQAETAFQTENDKIESHPPELSPKLQSTSPPSLDALANQDIAPSLQTQSESSLDSKSLDNQSDSDYRTIIDWPGDIEQPLAINAVSTPPGHNPNLQARSDSTAPETGPIFATEPETSAISQPLQAVEPSIQKAEEALPETELSSNANSLAQSSPALSPVANRTVPESISPKTLDPQSTVPEPNQPKANHLATAAPPSADSSESIDDVVMAKPAIEAVSDTATSDADISDVANVETDLLQPVLERSNITQAEASSSNGPEISRSPLSPQAIDGTPVAPEIPNSSKSPQQDNATSSHLATPINSPSSSALQDASTTLNRSVDLPPAAPSSAPFTESPSNLEQQLPAQQTPSPSAESDSSTTIQRSLAPQPITTNQPQSSPPQDRQSPPAITQTQSDAAKNQPSLAENLTPEHNHPSPNIQLQKQRDDSGEKIESPIASENSNTDLNSNQPNSNSLTTPSVDSITSGTTESTQSPGIQRLPARNQALEQPASGHLDSPSLQANFSDEMDASPREAIPERSNANDEASAEVGDNAFLPNQNAAPINPQAPAVANPASPARELTNLIQTRAEQTKAGAEQQEIASPVSPTTPVPPNKDRLQPASSLQAPSPQASAHGESPPSPFPQTANLQSADAAQPSSSITNLPISPAPTEQLNRAASPPTGDLPPISSPATTTSLDESNPDIQASRIEQQSAPTESRLTDEPAPLAENSSSATAPSETLPTQSDTIPNQSLPGDPAIVQAKSYPPQLPLSKPSNQSSLASPSSPLPGSEVNGDDRTDQMPQPAAAAETPQIQASTAPPLPSNWDSIADLLAQSGGMSPQTDPTPSPDTSFTTTTAPNSPTPPPNLQAAPAQPIAPDAYADLQPYSSPSPVIQRSPAIQTKPDLENSESEAIAEISAPESESETETDSDAAKATSGAKLEELAQVIYRMMQQRMAIDRERSGSDYASRFYH